MNKNIKRIVSGMRPTGRMHLGNYHGVIKNWTELQNTHECLFFIADMHALTTHYEKYDSIKHNIKNIIIEWLACGIDPKKCTIFIQSNIPETFELHLILSMITQLSWLERIPTYKEKCTEANTYGFLGYPVLQGADVLIFNADYVPIGYDQIPHIEIIRKIVRKFNYTFNILNNKNKFTLKEPIELINNYSKVIGIDGKKMSKSNENTILLIDDSETIKKKIKKMQTDPNRIFRYNMGNPALCNVWLLHQIYSDNKDLNYIETSCKTAKIGCIECKNFIHENLLKVHTPILNNIKEYEKDEKKINNIIKDGAKHARKIAKKNLKAIKKCINIL
ncbi:MAG: tryptophan--tRNA ligase [Enterobacteriaceae bacterium]|nr:tryptophan--tRNA ligase [Enterobacteriaceae bacterium]